MAARKMALAVGVVLVMAACVALWRKPDCDVSGGVQTESTRARATRFTASSPGVPLDDSLGHLHKQKDGHVQEDDHALSGAYLACLEHYETTRANVFVSGDMLAQELLARDDQVVLHAVGALDPGLLEQNDSSKASDSPLTLPRMRAIDILELFAKADTTPWDQQDALAGLSHVVAQRVDRGHTARVKRMLIAEKFDALAALARVAPFNALAAVAQLESAQVDALLPAIQVGLVDQGMKHAEATAFIAKHRPAF